MSKSVLVAHYTGKSKEETIVSRMLHKEPKWRKKKDEKQTKTNQTKKKTINCELDEWIGTSNLTNGDEITTTGKKKKKVCVIEEILLRTVDVYNFACVGCRNTSDLIT